MHRAGTRSHHQRTFAWLLALGSLGTLPSATPVPDLPFAPGERMTYVGRVHVGVGGSGTIWVEGPVELRERSTWVLHSDMEGKLGPVRATVRSASWIDPAQMASLRYTSSERHLWKKRDEAFDIYAAERRWKSRDGTEGPVPSEEPLDELSFLFYLRTLPLAPESQLTLNRHFDESRNPTLVRVVGRGEVEVDAGRFRAIEVEMRVRDPRHYEGEGTIRIHLSDDRCRLLLRLESKLPGAGTATLGLASYEGARTTCTARI